MKNRLRWGICGLLFFATTVNYMDRQVLGILKPTLEKELGWQESDFGWIVFAFQGAYALMMPIAGRIIDWLGVKIGYTLAVIVWSLASMSHSLARTPLQFGMARFMLGIGEAANFPAAIKTIALWFPRRERALATGIFNSGSNIGAIVAPLLVPIVAAAMGWRSAFLVTGALDIVWLVAWLLLFQLPKRHKLITPQELAIIQSDNEDETPRQIPFGQLVTKRAAWAFLLGKFLTDPVWWFYLYWVPGFLNKQYNLDLTHLGPPLIVIYLSADIGSIGGGWLSSFFVGKGWDLTRARKTSMLICAFSALPVIGIMFTGGNLWLTVLLLCFATAAHQGWSANLYTLTSDTFPRAAVGSVVGFGGMGGAIGGMLAAPIVGYWLTFSHSAYGPLFVVAGCMYLIALFTIHKLLPKLEQTNV